MREFLEAIESGASGDEIGALALPESYRAAVVLKDEMEMFGGVPSEDKDPQKALHTQDIAVPELAPDEAVIAVMASAINFNTVWTSIFEPLPTFGFLKRLGKESKWRRLGKDIRAQIGRDVDIVFEHPGRQTFGASVFVAARGGTIVTCAATSGFMIEYDNRHLWMKLKRIVASHFANYKEAWEANRLLATGKVQPILSAVYPLEQTGEAAYQVHHNLHEGKIGVLCLAPGEGHGIDDPELRAKVGEDRITLFRRHGSH